jgi:cytochrome c
MMTPFTRVFIYSVIVADLFAVIYFGGSLVLTGSILPEHGDENKVIVAGADQPAGAEAAAPKADAKPFDLASYVADPVKGEKVAAKCKACHTFESGGPNRTGPNLFGIVGAPVEHKADFSYSAAMADHKAQVGTWTEKNLFDYLESPRDVVPGTKMQFNGVKDPAERADLIAWLKTLK